MKKTSGGNYNADDPRHYFIAGNPERVAKTRSRSVLVAVNELRTPRALDTLDRMLDEDRRVLLDSGIFNLAMGHAKKHQLSMDAALTLPPDALDGFATLRDDLYRIVSLHHDRLWGFIELDQGGPEVKPETRAKIEADLGLVPMPVYHPLLDGWAYYDQLASEYDRICFGNLVKASPPVRLRLIHTAAERARNYPHLWTHLLGVTPNQNWFALPMRGSCDSSSWVTSVRWMPSWRLPSHLRMVTALPPGMWYRNGEGGNQKKADQMNDTDVVFWERTVEAMDADLAALGERA